LVYDEDVLYDFYFEVDYINKNIKENKYSKNSILARIRADFTNCLSLEKNCEYENLRAHYCDFRSKFPVIYEFEFLKLHSFLSDYQYNDGEIDISKYESINDPITYFKKHNEMVEKFLKDDIIQKELSKSIYREEILMFISIVDKINTKTILEFIDKNKKLFDDGIFTRHNSKDYLKYLNYYNLLYGVVMDIYTLARMFKIFGNDSIAENIIFYGGDHHCNLYRKFLAFIGAKKTIDIKGDNKIFFSEHDKERSFLFKTEN
jgi:hypothetical protein